MIPKIRKLGMAIVVVISTLVLLMPALAFAQNPSFTGGNPTINKTISSYNATLTVSGNVAGLGNQVTAVYLATTNVTAEITCQNNNGTHSPGQTATFDTTTGQIQYITPRNGQITFNDTAPLSITVTDAQIDCPGEMTPVISSAIFYDVTLYVQQVRTTLAYNFGNVKDP
jgi:hypothetical protein